MCNDLFCKDHSLQPPAGLRAEVSIPRRVRQRPLENHTMESSTPTLIAFADLPKDSRTLCMDVLLPRPIHTRDGYRAALAVAEAMAGHDLTKDQDD